MYLLKGDIYLRIDQINNRKMKNPLWKTESDDFFSQSEKDYHIKLEDENINELQVLTQIIGRFKI